MAADLSGVIGPFPGASFSDEYPGTQLIELDNGNFSHSLPDGCAGCSRAGVQHKCWKNLKLGPANASKLWMDELDAHAEAARDKVDIERALIYFMNLQAHGVLDVVTPTIQGLQPSATKSWPYVSCTAGQVRCTYASGTPDPRSIEVLVPTLNEDWGTGGGGSQYENETYGIGLRPTGIVSFSAPSAAAETKEYIAYKIRPASGGWDTFALDDDFIIYIFGAPDSALVETIFPPGDPGDISVQLQHYHPITEEPWATYRHSYPWPVERASKTFPLVDDSIHVIEAVKAVPFWLAGWLTATHTVLGVPTDVTATVVAACDIVRESGQWKTIMDLTPHGGTFDGTGSLAITYYRDSAADHAVHCGINKRCANHMTDPTGTWGEYCNYRADRGNGEVASEGANFVSTGCLLTQCSKWTPATPTSPVNQAVHKQIINDFPWTMQQALAGFQQNELIRSGTPSLASLAGQNMATPTGYHAQRLADAFEHAGWGKAKQGAGGLWYKMLGFEVDTFGAAGQLPDFRDESTWPEYGPGGNNFVRNAELPPEDATNLANIDSDPHRVQRSQIMKRSVSMHPYRGVESREGTLGKYIETSPNSLYQLFLPRIRASNRVDVQNFTDGSITPGYWDANLEELTEEATEEAVYIWRVLFARGRRYDRTVGNYNDFGGAVRTVTVKEAVEVEGGYVLYLANGTEQASSFISAQTERETQWKQGGTNVDPPELARTYNWQSSGRRGIDNSKVRQGMVIRATVANGFSAPLAIDGDDRTERRAWIARAIAHYDADHVEDFDPGVSQETRRNLQMGRIFFAFDTAGEVIETLTIKRDFSIENDQVITLAFYSGGNTKPVEINKDVYWWEPWADESIGLRGIFIYFSVLNGTVLPVDHNVTIYAETDAQTYAPQTVDLLSDALNGWDANVPVTFSFDRDVLAVTSVMIERRDGTTAALAPIVEPASWAEYPIDRYVVDILGGNLTIKVSPEHSMDTLKVIVTLDEYTDGNYYDDFVEFHGTFNGYSGGGSLPAGHRHFADRMDGLLIMDDGGLWKQWTDDNGGLGAWANRVLDVRDDGFAHWLELTLAKSHYNSEDADSEISGDDVKMLPANGEAFLKDILEDDDCLVLSGRIADRNAHARNEEAYSPVKALERMMG